MSSDEDDYMSDAFLQQCVDHRPGLVSLTTQRKHKAQQNQQEANKKNTVLPKKKLEALHREKGLTSSISSESKGFALLQKMGYKPGMGIGKHGTGKVEPVPIELKTGRSGLGRDTEMKRKQVEMETMRAEMACKRRRAQELTSQSFVSRQKEHFSEKNLTRDLRIAQTACLQLDQEQNIELPGESFFWPASSLPSLEGAAGDEDETESSDKSSKPPHLSGLEEDDEDDYGYEEENDRSDHVVFSDFEKLDILTRYLRNTYHHCIWCGTKYDDKADLDTNCPGNSAESHD